MDNSPQSIPPEPFPQDPIGPPSTPSTSPTFTRSTSSRNTHHHHPHTLSSSPSTTWREEEALLKHQLRNAKAEIQQLQAKLGLRSNAAPFNTSSPRKVSTSISPSPSEPLPPLPSSSTSASPSSTSPNQSLSVSPTRIRRTSSSSTTTTSNSTITTIANLPPPVPSSSSIPPPPPRTTSRNGHHSGITATTHHPAAPGPVSMNRALLSNEGKPRQSPPLSTTNGLPLPMTFVTSDTSQPSSSNASPIDPEFDPTIDRSLSPPPILLEAAAARNGGRYSDPTTSLNRHPYSSSSSSSSSIPIRSTTNSSTGENPFFGSTNTRERLTKSTNSSQSGSGRVISGLQSDLLQCRTMLESTRGQLRLSQRAVDFLGRQNEDLKETKERLTLEIESLNRQINRKERLQEEVLHRARTAETSLATLKEEHRNLVGGTKGRMKELEEREKKAVEAKVKVESEYASLRDGMRSMSEGWKADLDWIKADLTKSERELEQKATTLSKLLTSRSNLSTSISSTVSSLSHSQSEFIKTYTIETSSALRSLKLLSDQNGRDREVTNELQGEMERLKRNIKSADDDHN